MSANARPGVKGLDKSGDHFNRGSTIVDEVPSAYRRLARADHPDHFEGGSEPFQHIQEAYSVLGNPVKRRAYEKTLSNVRIIMVPDLRSVPEPEPLIPVCGPVNMGKISPARAFDMFPPSFDEVVDWLWNNFSTRQNQNA